MSLYNLLEYNLNYSNKKVVFKNCASVTKFITRFDGTTIDDAKDICFSMSLFNLFEYNLYYSDKESCLWLCSKGKANNFDADISNFVF